MSWRFRVVTGASVCGSRIGSCPGGLRRFVWILGRARRSLDRRKRSNFQRHSNRAGSLAQIEFLRHVVEAELARLNSVMPERQSRQIEMTVLIGPTDPRTPGARFGQPKIRAGHGHAAGGANITRGSPHGRSLRRLRLVLRVERECGQRENKHECEAESADSCCEWFEQKTLNSLTRG